MQDTPKYFTPKKFAVETDMSEQTVWRLLREQDPSRQTGTFVPDSGERA